jgi:hypothetical protein
MPPVIVKKGKGSDGDDDGAASGEAPPKQKLLPTGLSRAIVIASIFASLVVALSGLFANRFELVPAPNSTNGFMYRIDRLTGDVQFCSPAGCSEPPHPEK